MPAAAAGVLALPLTSLALIASGCGGGGGSPAVANLGTTGTTTTTTTATSGGVQSGGSTPQARGGGGQFAIAGGNRTRMTAFAACMRSHGEPNFPDPNAQGVISISSGAGLDPGSAQFQHAQQACAKLLPGGGTPSPAQQAQRRAQALAFSACMRSHGVPKFPDPQFLSGGRVAIQIGSSSGIDPQSPQFQAAQKVCGGPGGPKGPLPSTAGATTGGK